MQKLFLKTIKDCSIPMMKASYFCFVFITFSSTDSIVFQLFETKFVCLVINQQIFQYGKSLYCMVREWKERDRERMKDKNVIDFFSPYSQVR